MPRAAAALDRTPAWSKIRLATRMFAPKAGMSLARDGEPALTDAPPSIRSSATCDPGSDRVDWPARKLQRVRRARLISGLGGLLLTVSFFLPAVPGCNNIPIVPAGEWLDAMARPSGLPDLEGLAWGFLLYGACYLFGLLVFVSTLRSRGYRRRTEQCLGTSVSLLLGGVAVLIVGMMIWSAANGSWPSDRGDWLFVAFVVAGLAYWLRSRRLGPSGLICARWFAAISGLIWFGLWIVNGDALYGLWMSFTGCLLVLVGTSLEAVARNPEGGWATLWDLARCRFALHDLEGNRCVECDYLLIGLTSRRCPECGQPFELRTCP